MEVFFKILEKYGLPGILLLIIVLFVEKPERIDKIKEYLLFPLFNFFNLGAKKYIALKIGNSLTEFYNNHYIKYLPSSEKVKVGVKWVGGKKDPILKQRGKIIIRLKETKDQTRNILNATRISLPYILFHSLRKNVSSYIHTSIDLVILKKLVDKLGKHARPIFVKYFFEPETEREVRISDLLDQLIKIDNAGLFVAIFIEELNLLSEEIYISRDSEDKSEEIIDFMQFLLTIATRGIGQEVKLEYFSKSFSLGIVPLAKSQKILTKGLSPYLEAVNGIISMGCESIYVIFYEHSIKYVNKMISALKEDSRITIVNKQKANASDIHNPRLLSNIVLCTIRVNKISGESVFSALIKEKKIMQGDIVKGKVIDISPERAIINIYGLNTYINKAELSWLYVENCNEVIKLNAEYDFIINDINLQAEKVYISKRLPKEDPWIKTNPPKIKSIINVKIRHLINGNFIAITKENIEIYIPLSEISWQSIETLDLSDFIGKEVSVKVISIDELTRKIYASIRQTNENPWPIISQKYPKGTKVHGTVISVSPYKVEVRLQDGVTGYIAPESMYRAGNELSDYLHTVVKGQTLYLIVSKVFIERRTVRFDIDR